MCDKLKFPLTSAAQKQLRSARYSLVLSLRRSLLIDLASPSCRDSTNQVHFHQLKSSYHKQLTSLLEAVEYPVLEYNG